MDIRANNYPFQFFSCFLTLKFQNISHKKNISYEETFDKIPFQKNVLHLSTGEMKLA